MAAALFRCCKCARWKSGRGLPHSTTLARGLVGWNMAELLECAQSSGALDWHAIGKRQRTAALQDAVARNLRPIRFMAPMRDFEIVETSHDVLMRAEFSSEAFRLDDTTIANAASFCHSAVQPLNPK